VEVEKNMKKNIVSLLAVGILVLSGFGAVALPGNNTEEKTISLDFSQPTITDEDQYVAIDMSETNSFLMEQNKPMLPSYIHTFTYPFGTQIKSVSCTPNNIQQQTITKDIMPTPEAVSAGYDMGIKKTQTSTDYGTDPYPNTWYEYDVGCGLDGQDRCIFVKVQVFPVQYHPAEKMIEWSSDIDIVVEYEEPTEPAGFRDEYMLVVLAPSEYTGELSSLISHKINRGISTKLVTLTEVYGGNYFPATGRDNQEKIKYFIKNAIESWNTLYVLLVGGIAKLPARETHVYFDEGEDDEVFISELYYADIYDGASGFCSWDSNENDVFGEYDWGPSHNYDDVDLYPDVYIGRLACVSGTEVTTCVNKIKTYENDEAYTKDWFNDLVVIGGDHAAGDPHAIDEGEYVNQNIMDIMDGFIPETLWASEGDLTGVLPNGAKKINNAIDEGCGFIDFSGHGNTMVWSTHPHEDNSVWIPTAGPIGHGYLNSPHISGLNNGNELPIVIIGACSTCKYNIDPDCFGWSWLINNGGGGIGAIGASALDWFYYGTYVAEKGFEKICIDSFQAYDDGAGTFGEMWGGAVNGYIYPSMDALDHKTVEEFQPFGDPSLAIRGDSQAPNKPSRPDGPTSGKINEEQTYTTSSTEPDGDKISYMFDWGDTTNSGWIGPYSSGQTASASHTWTDQGSYEIRVKAQDEHGAQSDWSEPLSVSMPRNKPLNKPPFLQFLENHPMLYQLLQRLLNL